MKSTLTHIKKSPAEVSAYLITKCTDSARTQEQLDTVSRMIDNFCNLFGNGIRTELRGYVAIRRRELKLQDLIRSNKRKLYDTNNWIRSFGRTTNNSMAHSIAHKTA